MVLTAASRLSGARSGPSSSAWRRRAPAPWRRRRRWHSTLEPSVILAAFFNRYDAGGVRISNEYEWSEKTVIFTGIGEPSSRSGLGVELLAELHDGEAALAKRRTDGVANGLAFPAGNLEVDVTVDFLGHCFSSPPTSAQPAFADRGASLRQPSRPGRTPAPPASARPKMETATLAGGPAARPPARRCRSKVAKGPSATLHGSRRSRR